MLNKRSTIVIGIIIVLVIFGLLALFHFYNPSLHTFFPKCIFYSATNLHCPGCGTQRAFHDILQGNFIAGFKHNLLLLLLIVVLTYQSFISLVNIYSKKKHNNLLHKPIVTKGILIGVILFWVLRNINIFPFTALAP